jgi:hypothetical protein
MFSLWILTNITSARGTLHCRKTRIPCRDQLVICGQYGGAYGGVWKSLHLEWEWSQVVSFE